MKESERDELLIRIDERVSSLDSRFKDHVENHDTDVKVLGTKVSKLENFRSWFLGGLGVILFASGFAWILFRML